MNSSPIFIIGNPRSGTSLLRVIINAHPEILIPPECGFAIWLYPEFKNKNLNNKKVKLEFVDRLINTRKFETWKINTEDLKSYLLNSSVNSYGEIVDQVYQFYGQTHKITFKRWGDKNNFYLNNISEINEIFPSAQFIHIVRDGRDVASSYIDLASKEIDSKYKPELPESLDKIAIDWIRNNSIIINSLAMVDEDRKLFIRHEEVILNFENTMKRVTDFLGVSFSDQMKNFQNSNDAVEPEEFMQWKRKLYDNLDISSVGRYKMDLSVEQIETFNKIAGEHLKFFGYIL